MKNNEPIADSYIEIADKVRSGEYFRDARAMVDFDMHDPMVERYWYVFLTTISVVIVFFAVVAWSGFYPLKPRIPFIFATSGDDDYPEIKSLLKYQGENPDVALRRFLVGHYVRIREEYSAGNFDRNHDAVKNLSSKDVFDKYEMFILPLNPNSPIALYQRHTERKIKIVSTQVIEKGDSQSGGQDYYMRVIFNAILKVGDTEKPPTRHQVDIAFKYKDIKLDESTGNIEPYGFIVTSYHMKNL